MQVYVLYIIEELMSFIGNNYFVSSSKDYNWKHTPVLLLPLQTVQMQTNLSQNQSENINVTIILTVTAGSSARVFHSGGETTVALHMYYGSSL